MCEIWDFEFNTTDGKKVDKVMAVSIRFDGYWHLPDNKRKLRKKEVRQKLGTNLNETYKVWTNHT